MIIAALIALVIWNVALTALLLRHDDVLHLHLQHHANLERAYGAARQRGEHP